MPTCAVSAPAGILSPDQKASIAREVTRTHERITGARAFFAQVLFVDVRAGVWFIGGAPAMRSSSSIRDTSAPDGRRR